MENLNELFSEMMAKDDAYLKANGELRNACIRLLKSLPYDNNGEWFFEDKEPTIEWERNIDGYTIKGVKRANSTYTDTIALITENEELMMANEVSVDDLFYVARMARNEIAIRS